jgi:PAS domain S-box-containing protein
MSWVTVIWSVGVGTCLTLAFIQFVVWWKDRAARANLIFSVLAIAVATFAVLELALMRATTPEQFGTVVRWMHVPAWLMIASIVGFVRLYLKAGRQWLAWTVVGLRTVSLVLNFVFSPNINFREITTLQNVTFLGESVSVANGAANPWMLIAQSSLLLLVIFVTDATITVWRRGDRRKALMVGGSILFFVLMATVQAVGITWGIVSMPMTVSLFYQGLVIAVAYELSHDVFQATTLTRELQASEAGLRESEERFGIVADAAPVLIWMAGVDKLCTFFNKPWLDFTGRSLKQEMGNGWAEGVHPDDLQRCLKIYTEAFDARKAFVMQYRLRRNDGEYRWISDNGVPRYDAHKNFTGYIGSCIDVTELIIKDQALHDSKERIDLATKAAGLIVWSWDIARDEVWLSDKDRAIFGFSPSETLNAERIRSVVYTKDREFVSQLVEKSLATSEEIEAEYRIVLADGTVRWVTRRGRVEFDRDGKPAWERGVLMDVTERKQAEEKFRLAVEASPSGIVLVDREGKIVLVNTQTEKMFGYSRAEMIGQPVEIIIPRRFRAIHPTHRERFLAMPKARAMGAGRELFARRKDGTEFPIEIGLNPIETAEGILVLAAVADITARKQAELEALKHREEMAHRNRVSLMGEMTASFAHELNQPLTAIANNASAARRFLQRGNIDPALLQQLLHDMVADSQRAGEVIRGIRSLVRKEVGVRTLLDLNAVITDTVRLVSSDVLSRESVVTTELDPQLPQVNATLVQIQQVLLNLIMNALDAMDGLPPAERRIVIRTRSDKGDVVEVSVRDFGTGLPKDQPNKVFDHFFSTKQKGMGMGLTIVRSIIEAHGGTIVAENAPERGARMIVRLPAVRGQTQTIAAA